MNREIKFRIWDKVIGDWMTPYIDESCEWEDIYCVLSSERLVFQQFTGLLDKNGKEIYEGDIVKWVVKPLGLRYDEEFLEWEKSGKPMQSVTKKVEWKHNSFDAFSDNAFTPSNPEECEVIGNTFENPELLK